MKYSPYIYTYRTPTTTWLRYAIYLRSFVACRLVTRMELTGSRAFTTYDLHHQSMMVIYRFIVQAAQL